MSDSESIVLSLSESESSSSLLSSNKLRSKTKAKKSSSNKYDKKCDQITGRKRAHEFGKNGIAYVGGVIICKFCSGKQLDSKKSTIQSHCKGTKHKQNAEKNGSLQTTLNSSFNNQNLVNDMNREALKAFAEANIPIHKFDHPSIRGFFNKWVKNGANLNSSRNMRRNVDDLADEKRQKIISIIKKSNYYSLIVDETCDTLERSVLNIIILPSKENQKDDNLNSFLLNTFELDNVNHENVASKVIQCINDNGLSLSKMFGIITDNASYMKKAFELINVFCKNSVHITCWSHIFDLVAQTFRISFPEVDNFVAKMKSAFNHRKKLTSLYKRRCKVAPPKPVKTRWSSWLKAVQVHSKHFDNYKIIFNEIKKEKLGKSAALKTCGKLIETRNLKAKLEFINQISGSIINAITATEEMKVNVNLIYNQANDLHDYFNNLMTSLREIEDEDDFIEETISAVNNSLKKLKKYIFTGNQPAFKFLNQIRVFDPVQASSAQNFKTLDLFDLKEIPFWNNEQNMNLDIKTKLRSEFSKYKQMVESKSFSLESNCLEFWNQNLLNLPNLAPIVIGYLSIPISGAEVERSFSQLNDVLTPKRRNLLFDNLKNLLFINYNCDLD